MKIFIITLFLVPLCLFANISQNIINSAANGKQVTKDVEQETIASPTKEVVKTNTYTNEVILTYLYAFESATPKTTVASITNGMVYKFPDQNLTDKNSNDKNASNEVHVTGFCVIDANIKQGKQPGALMTYCQSNFGQIQMFANLIGVNEKESLVVDPVYIEFAKSGNRYNVVKSSVTNEARTSYNVATWVNNRALEKVKYEVMDKSAGGIKTVSNEYLRALEESKKSTTTLLAADNTYTSSAALLAAQKTEKPDASTYLAKAAIDVGAAAVQGIASVLKDDLPYFYEVSKGTRIYIDLTVNKEKIP